MNALENLRKKTNTNALEDAVRLFADYELEARKDGKNIIAEPAAAELARLTAIEQAAREYMLAVKHGSLTGLIEAEKHLSALLEKTK